MSTKNIFIVDDDPVLCEMLSDFLKEQLPQLRISNFATGENCLKSLYKDPNVVILDYCLNSQEKNAANGIDILKEIKAKKKSLPVIMLSGQKKYGVAIQSIGCGAIYYVNKDMHAFEEVLTLVKAHI